jgi:hypothetical protein
VVRMPSDGNCLFHAMSCGLQVCVCVRERVCMCMCVCVCVFHS